ncbi:protein of unknown function [Massilia sp. PDC64]|nr:DUF4123 domain-containing protein [Massilia sp. PDC64]SDC89488.1 protein of unknown function [Massilia sp. PDC64]
MSYFVDLGRVVEKFLVACPNSNLYFLLDHGGLPGLHRELLKSCVAWMSLFEHTSETSALAVAPILVLVCKKNRRVAPRSLLEWTANNGTFSSSIVILASPLDLDEIGERLSSRLDARLSDNLEVMLRFFDPRVLGSLIKIMPEDQKNAFLGLAESWAYVDRAGDLIDISVTFNDRENFSTPFAISQQQEFALLEASEIDQVLDVLRSNFPDSLALIKKPEQSTFVACQIDSARKLGFNSVLQFSLHAARLLLEGDGFVNSPVYPEFLDEVRSNGW